MEGQRNHSFLLAQIYGDHPVVIGYGAGMHGPISILPVVGGIKLPGFLIGFPDGGQAGGFRGHDVNAIAEIHRQPGNTRPHKFQHPVVDKAAVKRSLDQRQRHIVRTNAMAGRTGQIDQDHLWHGSVPGILQQLLCQLRTALAHSHGAQSAIAGVGIRSQNHAAAGGHLLPCVGMDHRLIGRDVNAAVLFGSRKAKDMIVLIDGPAYGAEAVVAIGQGIGHGESLHPRGPGLLDDPDIGDIVRNQGIKTNFQSVGIAGGVMGLQNFVGHGLPLGLLRRNWNPLAGNSVYQICAMLGQFDHKSCLLIMFGHLPTFVSAIPWEYNRLHVPRNKKYPLRNRNGYKLFAWHTGISVSGSGRNLGSSRYPDLFPIGTSQ